jgi:hypothetical protein
VAANALARARKTGDLAPCQLGVGAADGLESILRKVQDKFNDNVHSFFVILYLKNEFNKVSRYYLAAAVLEHIPHLFRVVRRACGDFSSSAQDGRWAR